jgi:hypothetical protein
MAFKEIGYLELETGKGGKIQCILLDGMDVDRVKSKVRKVVVNGENIYK